jgi:hypothetical protein
MIDSPSTSISTKKPLENAEHDSFAFSREIKDPSLSQNTLIVSKLDNQERIFDKGQFTSSSKGISSAA